MNSTTLAANEFTLKFKTDIQSIQDYLQTSDMDKAKEAFAQLEQETTDACLYLPLYDQKTCQSALNELKPLLFFKPKSKFSFKSKVNVNNKTPNIQPEETMVIKDKEMSIPENALVINEKAKIHIKVKATMEPKDVYIINCTSCIIDTTEMSVVAIHIKNVYDCVLHLGNAQGSFLAYSMSNCLLMLACHQFRIHDSINIHSYLSIPSHPIIEDCKDMVFGEYKRDDLTELTNEFDKVLDFNWHKKTPSPHFRISNGVHPCINDLELKDLNLFIKDLPK